MAVAIDYENEMHYSMKVENTDNFFFKIWNISLLPKVVSQPKWHRDSVIEIKDLANVEELINAIQRKDVAMPRVDPIRNVRSSSGSYEVAAADIDADIHKDASADCGCCCNGHINLIHLPGIKMADVDPFSTLMAADVIPNVYPEAEDDEVVGDLPLPGENDDLYAVLIALETMFDLYVCRQKDAKTSLSLIDFKR